MNPFSVCAIEIASALRDQETIRGVALLSDTHSVWSIISKGRRGFHLGSHVNVAENRRVGYAPLQGPPVVEDVVDLRLRFRRILRLFIINS